MTSTPGLEPYLDWYTEWTFLSNIVGDLSPLDMFDQYMLSVSPKVQEAALHWTEKQRDKKLAPSLEDIHSAMCDKLTKGDTLFHLKSVQNARRSRSTPAPSKIAQVAAVTSEDKKNDRRVYIPRHERLCTHCHKAGHMADACFDKFPDLLKKFRARSKSKDKQPPKGEDKKPFKPYRGYKGCLECQSMDHMVRNCPKKK